MLLSIQASLNSIISFRPGIVNRVSCIFSVSSQHTNYLKSIVQYGHEKTDPYGSVLIRLVQLFFDHTQRIGEEVRRYRFDGAAVAEGSEAGIDGQSA